MDPQIADDEELQKFREWWKANGTSILVGIAIGVAALGGYNGWQYYTESRSESAATLFSQLQAAMRENRSETVPGITAELREDYGNSPYAASAALLAAKDAVDQGDNDRARQLLEWVVEATGEQSFQHTARLRLAYLDLQNGDAESALTRLEVDDETGFESQFAELKADANRALGRLEAADTLYAEAIAALPPGSAYIAILEAKQSMVR